MSRKAMAYHEAGHAIAAWHHDFKLHSVSIEPTTNSAGRMRCVNPLQSIRLGVDNTPRARIRIENSIITCLAGPIAERRVKPRSFRRWHAEDDYGRAVDLALRLCGHRQSAGAYLKWLEIRTKDLMDAHWQSVERLAIGLLKKPTLKSDDILALIGRPQRAPALSEFSLKTEKPQTNARRAPPRQTEINPDCE